MFRATSAHHQEGANCINTSSGITHWQGDCSVCWSGGNWYMSFDQLSHLFSNSEWDKQSSLFLCLFHFCKASTQNNMKYVCSKLWMERIPAQKHSSKFEGSEYSSFTYRHWLMRTTLILTVCTWGCQTLKMFMTSIHCTLGKSTLSSSATVSCVCSTSILITYFTKIKFNIIFTSPLWFPSGCFSRRFPLKKKSHIF
jgi:hypothetical protein